MAAPVIGISTYREEADWLSWRSVPAALVPADYVDAVRDGGGIPVLLPLPASEDEASTVVSRLDGLVISGGSDLNPALYRQAPLSTTCEWRDDRDASEIALLDAAEVLGLPILGICRGMQLMATRAGGGLHQHLPLMLNSDAHCPKPNAYGSVAVKTVPGTRLAEILGREVIARCNHHQAVAEQPGFVVSACAADGVTEAIEAEGGRFLLGVQWHPEVDFDTRLFKALATAAS